MTQNISLTKDNLQKLTYESLALMRVRTRTRGGMYARARTCEALGQTHGERFQLEAQTLWSSLQRIHNECQGVSIDSFLSALQVAFGFVLEILKLREKDDFRHTRAYLAKCKHMQQKRDREKNMESAEWAYVVLPIMPNPT